MTRPNCTNIFRSVVIAVIVFAGPPYSASASILLLTGPPTVLDSNLVSYTIKAFSTSGEIINSFSNPSLTPIGSSLGPHQVRVPLTDAPTPTRQSQLNWTGLWNDIWRPYDSYFFFTDANSVKVGPGVLSESESGTGASLPSAGIVPPNTGFGGITTTGGVLTYSATLGGGLQGTDVPFMQVVVPQNGALALSLAIGTTTGIEQSFQNFQIPNCLCGITVDGGYFGNVNTNVTGMIMHTFELYASGVPGPYTWSDLSFDKFIPAVGTPTPIQPGQPATLDPITHKFSWNTAGAPLGFYRWYVTVTALGGNYSSIGMLDVRITVVPEPSSIAFLAAALLSAFGHIRRR